jgi:hypothetical protein
MQAQSMTFDPIRMKATMLRLFLTLSGICVVLRDLIILVEGCQ